MFCRTTSFRVFCILAAVQATLSHATTAHAGAFANLDFEASSLVPATPPSFPIPDPVSTELLFPSWTLRIGDSVQPTGFFNVYTLAGAQGALMASLTPQQNVIEGAKSVYLSGWVFGTSTSLSQVGDVPAGTESVRFIVRDSSFGIAPIPPSPLLLRMDGQNVPLVLLSQSGTGDFVYGGDISAWAGLSAELRIGVGGYVSGNENPYGIFDSISFSPEPVPEPASAAVLIVAAAGMLRRMRPAKFF